jgi:sugar phosphate permease
MSSRPAAGLNRKCRNHKETSDDQADGKTGRSRWLALYVLCAGVLMIVLDATVVNVALPSIQDDLGFSTSSLAWVVNAYLIAFGGTRCCLPDACATSPDAGRCFSPA